MEKQDYQPIGGLDDMTYFTWFVSAQMLNEGRVIIKSTNKIYSDSKSQWPVRDVCISKGNCSKQKGEKIYIEISVKGSFVCLVPLKREQLITNNENEQICCTFMYALEDGTDYDYNDIVIFITGWKSPI